MNFLRRAMLLMAAAGWAIEKKKKAASWCERRERVSE